MEFRDLKRQYSVLKDEIDREILEVIHDTAFIQGKEVRELEVKLAEYVGVKHCITCANGTDALLLALKAWGITKGDVVFVPDFTFFSSGEVVSALGATPKFVDVEWNTCNMDPKSLEKMIQKVVDRGEKPKAIVTVDLFGQPADYTQIRLIADKYNLLLLEDGAQGFGGSIRGKKACSFGDISTTSFFPAKQLGCYGDGGAVFTDNDEWAELIRSYCVHGKGVSKYDNVRIGMNSRLDTIQAAILLAKIDHFSNYEMERMQEISKMYSELLDDVAIVPVVREGYESSWAQYTIKLKSNEIRENLSKYLRDRGIPSAVYYRIPMHRQKAFEGLGFDDSDYPVTIDICDKVLSLPFHPYLENYEVEIISKTIRDLVN